MKLVIIDYGLCNLLSVFNAVKHLGHHAIVSSDPKDLDSADAVILPGVGAFEDGMRGLREKHLLEPIFDFVKTGKPFLGICLGMQFLMTKSYEFGEHLGLNLIPGEVISFKNQKINGHYDLRIPHIGWNHLLHSRQSWDKTILQELNHGDEMYFVHSFYVVPEDPKHILAETEYGQHKFCSVVQKDNVYGCQFHPEKSSQLGLKILNNFINLVNVGSER